MLQMRMQAQSLLQAALEKMEPQLRALAPMAVSLTLTLQAHLPPPQPSKQQVVLRLVQSSVPR